MKLFPLRSKADFSARTLHLFQGKRQSGKSRSSEFYRKRATVEHSSELNPKFNIELNTESKAESTEKLNAVFHTGLNLRLDTKFYWIQYGIQ